MEYRDRIESNPDVLRGKPIIKGTRISVEFVLENLAEGMSFEEFLREYPHISEEDVRAALAYSAAVISREEILA